ncbi:MAG: hypothetical protein RR630_07005 [Coprobacillus sp.]
MKKWKKYLLYGFIGFLIIGTLGAIFGETPVVKALSIQEEQLSLDTKKEKEIEITIEPSHVRLSKSDFTVGDDSIVEIDSVDGNTITLKTLSNEGTTTLYCQRDDIKSNEITIQVTDQKKLALAKAQEQKLADEKNAEAKKLEEEKKAVEAKKTEDAKQAANAKKSQEQKQSTQKSTTSNKTSSSASSTKPTGQKVYITPTGSKYHAIAKCGNTKSSTLVSLSDAQSRGLGACKKCY